MKNALAYTELITGKDLGGDYSQQKNLLWKKVGLKLFEKLIRSLTKPYVSIIVISLVSIISHFIRRHFSDFIRRHFSHFIRQYFIRRHFIRLKQNKKIDFIQCDPIGHFWPIGLLFEAQGIF
jgi:hypothetical protein